MSWTYAFMRRQNLSLRKIQQHTFAKGKSLIRDLKGTWHYRLGDYRIIAEIKDRELIIIVLAVGTVEMFTSRVVPEKRACGSQPKGAHYESLYLRS
jgi:mRNA-degrading endonuclease RelE of RelBE toxin-antitoxin system